MFVSSVDFPSFGRILQDECNHVRDRDAQRKHGGIILSGHCNWIALTLRAAPERRESISDKPRKLFDPTSAAFSGSVNCHGALTLSHLGWSKNVVF
jgi:hypothetical protein